MADIVVVQLIAVLLSLLYILHNSKVVPREWFEKPQGFVDICVTIILGVVFLMFAPLFVLFTMMEKIAVKERRLHCIMQKEKRKTGKLSTLDKHIWCGGFFMERIITFLIILTVWLVPLMVAIFSDIVCKCDSFF